MRRAGARWHIMAMYGSPSLARKLPSPPINTISPYPSSLKQVTGVSANRGITLDGLHQRTVTENHRAAPLERPEMAEMLGRGKLDVAPATPASRREAEHEAIGAYQSAQLLARSGTSGQHRARLGWQSRRILPGRDEPLWLARAVSCGMGTLRLFFDGMQAAMPRSASAARNQSAS